MKWLCVLSLSLLCGCGTLGITSPRYVQELGYIDSDIGTRTLLADTNQEPIDAIQYSLRAEAEVWRSDCFAVDLGAGPTAIFPIKSYNGEAFGAEAIARLIWKVGPIEPYLSVSQGAVYHEQAWDPVIQKYGFPTQFGIGIRKKIESGVLLGFEYRWWHNSWGASKLGSDFRDTFGLGNKGLNPGHEGGGLFFNVSVPF